MSFLLIYRYTNYVEDDMSDWTDVEKSIEEAYKLHLKELLILTNGKRSLRGNDGWALDDPPAAVDGPITVRYSFETEEEAKAFFLAIEDPKNETVKQFRDLKSSKRKSVANKDVFLKNKDTGYSIRLVSKDLTSV